MVTLPPQRTKEQHQEVHPALRPLVQLPRVVFPIQLVVHPQPTLLTGLHYLHLLRSNQNRSSSRPVSPEVNDQLFWIWRR